MEYRYEDIVYNKRPLTDNVIFRVVGYDFSVVKNKDPEFKKMCWMMKAAEAAGQADTCPVTGRADFIPIIDKLRDTYPGFRARYTQSSPVLLIEEAADVTPEDALYLIANGSTALLAKSFTEDAIETLLEAGIMPITVTEQVEIGTFIFVKNMLNDFKLNTDKLTAYLMSIVGLGKFDLPEMVPTDILGLPAFNPQEMEPFPAYRLKAVVE